MALIPVSKYKSVFIGSCTSCVNCCNFRFTWIFCETVNFPRAYSRLYNSGTYHAARRSTGIKCWSVIKWLETARAGPVSQAHGLVVQGHFTAYILFRL